MVIGQDKASRISDLVLEKEKVKRHVFGLEMMGKLRTDQLELERVCAGGIGITK